MRRIRHSRNVIFAIGYFDHPNYIGVPGEKLPHVSHYYNESHGFYRKNVVIVGGGNSAAETALELFRSGAHVTLVHRHPQLKPSIKYWVRPDIENRIKEGSVRGLLNTTVVEILPTSVIVERDGAKEEIPADAVFLLTGYHPDCDLYRRAGIRLHRETMAPEFNPDTFETNVPGIFLAGGAICGRDTSNIFIENGRFHGETIISVLAERLGKQHAGARDRRMSQSTTRTGRHPPAVGARRNAQRVESGGGHRGGRSRVRVPAVIRRIAGGHAGIAGLDLLPYQQLIRDAPAADQRIFRELQEGLLEAERIRAETGQWPDVTTLAAEGIPPFARGPDAEGRIQVDIGASGLGDQLSGRAFGHLEAGLGARHTRARTGRAGRSGAQR